MTPSPHYGEDASPGDEARMHYYMTPVRDQLIVKASFSSLNERAVQPSSLIGLVK